MTDVAPSGSNGRHAEPAPSVPAASAAEAASPAPGSRPRTSGSARNRGYGTLPPGARVAKQPEPMGERLPFARSIRRGLTWRCPRCGTFRPWSEGWFGRAERCRGCGYKYERQEGFLLGAVTMNTIVTFGLLALVLLVGSIASYPHIAVAPILVVAVVLTVCVPILFYPVSYTLWAAVDLAMRPLEPAEVADAEAHRSPGP